MVQFNKFVTCTQQDGNNQIQENWRLKSIPCWQYSSYEFNLSVFVMYSPVISGFLFLMLKKFPVNVMNGVCGTSLQIALTDVTEIWQLLWTFLYPFSVECQGD